MNRDSDDNGPYCCFCDFKGGVYEAAHLIPSSIKDREDMGLPEKYVHLHSVEVLPNFILLCPNCHRCFDKGDVWVEEEEKAFLVCSLSPEGSTLRGRPVRTPLEEEKRKSFPTNVEWEYRTEWAKRRRETLSRNQQKSESGKCECGKSFQ